jgi:hypothetical protein
VSGTVGGFSLVLTFDCAGGFSFVLICDWEASHLF